jgi:biotin transporter BioY
VPDLLLPLAALLPQSVTPYVVLMLAGFAVGILGHLTGSRWLVGAGIVLIGLGAFLLPVFAHLAA